MRRTLAGIAIGALVLAGCGGSGSDGAATTTTAAEATTTAPAGETVHGTVALGPVYCGSTDWSEGEPVAILDGAGKQLAVGQIDRKRSTGGGKCVAEWSVDGVPSDASGYQVEVGGSTVDATWLELSDEDGFAIVSQF